MKSRFLAVALIAAAAFSLSPFAGAYQDTAPVSGLYERVATTGAPNKLAVHRLSAALGEWAVGNLTRAQVIAGLNLDATETAEVDAIAAVYMAKATAAEKVGYLWQIERCFILVETGDYSKAKAKAVLGF